MHSHTAQKLTHRSPTLKAKYDFPDEIFDIIIGGKSSIDSTTAFHAQSLQEADRFIQSYGYDLENPIERAEVLGNFHEAINFIRKYFLIPENPEGLKLEPPRKILELTDIRELFLMASGNYPGQTADTQGRSLQNWACSLLKVMHTIAHIDKDIRTSYFPDIQKQIFDRFYKLIIRDTHGQLFLGEKSDDPNRIPLVTFEAKPKKSRNSIILKLLHKPENVAEDIFDRVGIRFITPTTLGALRVIKYLKDKMIIMSPHIKPSRSRNTLFDVDYFKPYLKYLFSKTEIYPPDIPPDLLNNQLRDQLNAPSNDGINNNHSSQDLTEAQLVKVLEKALQTRHSNDDQTNPHSSKSYQAIQFTCRQLIKLKNPLYHELKELKTLIKEKISSQAFNKIAEKVEKIDLKYLQREVRFFYPFEVQIMDAKSAEENEKGRSAHSEYKRAQVTTAMKRVMASFLT